MKLFDAHTHLQEGENWDALFQTGAYFAAATASMEAECAALLAHTKQHANLFGVFGIHPWHAGKVTPEVILPYLHHASAIGEIGLDSVWCSVPLSIQRRVFLSQLELAEELQKPIVLHTKGAEAEIAGAIKNISVPILVHWYSSMEHLSLYLSKDCFFTLGPDIYKNPAVRQVAAAVPLNRLMVESDGLTGAGWGIGREVKAEEIPGILEEMIAFVAELRQVPCSALSQQLYENALRFYSPQ